MEMSENSENYTPDQALQGSSASEDGNGGFDGIEHEAEHIERSVELIATSDLELSSAEGVSGSVESSDGVGLDDKLVKSSESEQNPIVEMPVPKEEASNSFVDAESSSDTLPTSVVVDGDSESVVGDKVLLELVSTPVIEPITVVEMHGSVDQESRSFLGDHVDHDNGILINTDNSVGDNPDDENQTKDSGKDEMFVDAPDQLTAYDGKNVDIGELVAIIETQDSPEKKCNIQESQLQVVEDGKQDRQLMDELAWMQAMLDKTVGEKEIMAREYKEERELFARELANLHQQLEVMTNQQSLLVENGNGLVDRLRRAEQDGEDKMQVSDTPLHVMIRDCSKFTGLLKSTLDEQLQSEGTIRELHAVLFTKDQEIEDLSVKLSELSVSSDVVVSYLESLQSTWSQSLRESSKVQLERDLHLEVVMKRLLVSLPSVVQQEELLDDSVIERISLVEKGTSLMIENYNQFLSEIDQLGQCLTEVRTDFKMPEGTAFGFVFDVAREEVLECKRKDLDLVEKLNQLEEKNRKLMKQLDMEKERVEVADAKVSKTNMELEQEKIRSATAKEKLSLAVTKGKALVQQRDSLKQLLTEKTNELEKCLLEIQEKSNALEAAVESQSLAVSLQELLSQREMVLKEIEEVLSQIDMHDRVQSMDISERVRWLANQRNMLEGVSLEYHKLKDSLSSIDLPEVVSSSELECQVNWLGKSFSLAKDDIIKLQGEIASTQVAVASHESELAEARNEIDRLTVSLLAEKQENNSLQMGLEDLSYKYEAIVDKEFQVSSEKAGMMRMFLEAFGMDGHEGLDQPYSDMATILENCIGKIKEQVSASFKSSHVRTEQFERMQSLLYVRDQELVLCEEILEEETLERSEMSILSHELKRVSQEVIALKDERDSQQKDLERSDEKLALLREKLSMAVKKGKGLVQEREGLKHSLHEKSTEIEKLKLELQQQESELIECRDQINRLSSDLENIPKLKSELVAMKDQRDQLEQFLLESNSMLQRVMESIESIVLPVGAVFEEPVEKVKWLAECFSEYQVGKTYAEQELEIAKEEASSLASKLSEADATMKSLEDALSQVEKNNSLLAEENKDIQAGKTYVEQEFEKAKEEASSQASKLAEACTTIKSLEDALSLAEKNISVLVEEKTAAQVDKSCAEKELEKAKEEASCQGSKLAESYMTIKSLEDALSQVDDAQVGKTSLEKELEKVKDEAGSQASKLADAYATVKSLEDALSQAENNISVLINDRKNAEQEILALNAKLSASMEELARTHGSLESQSVELFGQLNHLSMLMKDEALLSLLTQGFKKKIESLRDMGLLLENIRDQFVEKGSEQLQVHAGTEKDPVVAKLFSACLDNIPNGSTGISEISAKDLDDISSYFTKIVEGFNMKNKLYEVKFEGFSSSMDGLIAVLLSALQATRDEVIVMLEHMESLKLKVKNLEADKQAQESTISTLQNNITVLLSACTEAAEKLQFEVDNSQMDPSFNLELEKLKHCLYSGAREAGGNAEEGQRERLGSIEYVKAAENLLLVASNIRIQIKQFENIKNVSLTTIEDLQNKLREIKVSSENALQERDLNRNRVSKLESDLEALKNFCSEMELKLQDYQAKEDMLREKDAELSSSHRTLAMKGQEVDGRLLSEGQVKTLFEKINGIEIPFKESELENPELHSAAPVNKLFYIIDNVTELQHQMELLSCDKEDLLSCLAAQVRDIEHLKKEAESINRNNQDAEKTKSDLAEMALNLEKIIQKLGGNDLVEDKESVGARGLLPVLEKLVMTLILECETSKSNAEELGAKLHDNQKVVDELSAKVKLLDDSIHSGPAPSDAVQERGIFEASSLATGSEISEIEDAGSLGRTSISPVPSAHVRTMRKGSSEHLALNIDSESDRLINHNETDDDKGHVFKSLNTSGLIPKQGKLIADRIDGIWVSGGRVLMSQPRARIGLIAYWIFLHIWLLGTIL